VGLAVYVPRRACLSVCPSGLELGPFVLLAPYPRCDQSARFLYILVWPQYGRRVQCTGIVYVLFYFLNSKNYECVELWGAW
jgi:hypothetical protein